LIPFLVDEGEAVDEGDEAYEKLPSLGAMLTLAVAVEPDPYEEKAAAFHAVAEDMASKDPNDAKNLVMLKQKLASVPVEATAAQFDMKESAVYARTNRFAVRVARMVGLSTAAAIVLAIVGLIGDEGNAKAFVMSKEGSERGQDEEGSEASGENSSIQAILRSQCNSVDDRDPLQTHLALASLG
jgi:hypothetical protein